MNMPSVDIIIPSLNSPVIDRVIDAIIRQEAFHHVLRVFVIGKDDAGLLPDYPNVQLVDTKIPVPPGTARNLGIAYSSAEWLIFLDSDCIPQPNWLSEHMQALQTHAVVGGGVVPTGEGYWHRSYNLSNFHEVFSTGRPATRPLLPTLNLAVKRTVIEQVGLLNERLRRGQDMEWTTRMRRAGFQPYFWPAATVYHDHNRRDLAAVWRDCARSGYYSRQIRLAQADMLTAPRFLRYRSATLLLAPLLALVTTARIVIKDWRVFGRNLTTIPAIYLTKLAWAWGASRPTAPGTNR
ncbi:MAG: glycosyltransferase [Anaerolineae bacterium]|nr:glycosyltransferase [Anaerolineae bacterium]